MKNDKELQRAVLAVMLGKQVNEAKKPLHPNQQKLDVHEPEKDKLTAKDFAMLRAGKKSMKEDITEEDLEMVIEYALSEGWDDMLKAAKERAKPQPAGGAGIKQGRAYGGAKQKNEKPMKEDTDRTFGEYLQAAKAKFGEEEAVKIANDAFNAKDTSIFSNDSEA